MAEHTLRQVNILARFPRTTGRRLRLVCLNERDSCMAARRAWETVVRRGLRLALFVWEPKRTGRKTQNEEIEKGMSWIELFLIGVGLSMDAFAVSICKGLSMKKLRWRQGLLVGVFFGGFQAMMPLIGWALGRQFEKYITSVDHWIAFILLGYIGGKMIWDGFHGEDETCPVGFDLKELTMMAIATSIDALAVGITFAFLQVDILPAVGLIGLLSLIHI